MKFILDQGIPRSTVSRLRAINLDAEHVGQLGMARALDEEIIDKAIQDESIVVTLDSDFHTILASKNLSQPSVIRIRIEGLKGIDVANIIRKVYEHAEVELQKGSAVSVTHSAIRIKLLPLI